MQPLNSGLETSKVESSHCEHINYETDEEAALFQITFIG